MAHWENIVSNLLPLKSKLITKGIWQGASLESSPPSALNVQKIYILINIILAKKE